MQKKEIVLKQVYCTPLGLDHFITRLYELKREFSEYPNLQIEFGTDGGVPFFKIKAGSRQKVQL